MIFNTIFVANGFSGKKRFGIRLVANWQTRRRVISRRTCWSTRTRWGNDGELGDASGSQGSSSRQILGKGAFWTYFSRYCELVEWFLWKDFFCWGNGGPASLCHYLGWHLTVSVAKQPPFLKVPSSSLPMKAHFSRFSNVELFQHVISISLYPT